MFGDENFTSEKETEYIDLPFFLIHPFKQICIEENLSFDLVYEFESEFKGLQVLIFGNEIVSPDNFNLKQAYIVAEKFNAQKRNCT